MSDEQRQVMSYRQIEHTSYSHPLFYSALSNFAEGIENALLTVLGKDSTNFDNTLNIILNFIDNNQSKIKHLSYKNPEMLIIGYYCTEGGEDINVSLLKKYSKKYNINDIIRYCALVMQMNEE